MQVNSFRSFAPTPYFKSRDRDDPFKIDPFAPKTALNPLGRDNPFKIDPFAPKTALNPLGRDDSCLSGWEPKDRNCNLPEPAESNPGQKQESSD